MSSEKEKSLDIIITEQHRDLDYLLHIYNRMRAAQNILLTAGFAVIVYLYSSSEATATIEERFFIPDEDYGKVIYFIAAGFFVYGIIKLMINVFGSHRWETAYETTKDNYTYHNAEETKEYFKKRNDSCMVRNGQSYVKHSIEKTYLFYSVTISAIILIVIKSLT